MRKTWIRVIEILALPPFENCLMLMTSNELCLLVSCVQWPHSITSLYADNTASFFYIGSKFLDIVYKQSDQAVSEVITLF